MAFRKAVTSGKSNFFLALGEYGAIYGALSYVPIVVQDGSTYISGQQETLIFSVTNEKVFDYEGTSGKPLYTYFNYAWSQIGFTDGNTTNLSLDFDISDKDKHSDGNRIYIGAGRNFKILEVYEIN